MQANHPDFMVFTGNANPGMAADIARHLGTTLGAVDVGRFSDGEVTVEIKQNVRARDVFVVQSTCAPTNVACRLLDRRSGQCSNYRNRRAYVAECVRLTMRNVHAIDWLPSTCAYRLRAAGAPLPEWHYLVSGDREAVHRAGQSVRGWTISEDDAGELENHIVERDL